MSSLFSASAATIIRVESANQVIRIGDQIEFFRDESATKSIQEILRDPPTFQTYRGSVLNFENSSGVFWLKFELENLTGENIFLQFGNPELDEIGCYGVTSGKVDWQLISGSRHPFNTRYMQSNKVCLPIGSKSGTIYISIQARASLYLPLSVGSLKSLSDVNHKDDMFNGACIGIMLIMLLYNFFIFLSVRERLYLQYCLYLLSSTAMMLFIEGLQFDLLWRGNHAINNFYFTNIIVATTTSLAIWFSNTFLDIKNRAPRLKWVNALLLTALAASLVIGQIGLHEMTNKLVQTASGLTSLYLLILGIVFLINGYKEAKFYVVSWGILVSGAIIYLLTLNGVININFWTLNSFQIASMLEAVMLSFALADRINTYRREKHIAQNLAIVQAQENEQLIRDQNVSLEREVEVRTRDLNAEMQKTEDLLLNILPNEVARELKEKGSSEARLYNHVTVLFTDFVNFTGIGENLTPKELVQEIHHCFEAFDNITVKYGLEKIKTIGDAYMAVCGMPVSDTEHARKAILAALGIMDFINDYHTKGGLFELRIGIHSGPVVAGIVGIKKFAYDIWGDTVNTASRMESSSERGKINISESTYELIKDESEFQFEPRGEVEVKGKGAMKMWFVSKSN